MLRNSHDLLLSRANSWSEFLAGLKALGNSESANKQKGDAFERFVQLFLRYQPDYQQQLEEIWRHDELPFEVKQDLNISTDRGIDLVARTKEGDYWAIQAKYRSSPAGSIPLRDLGTFGTQLAVVAQGFSRGVICATKREKTPDFARAEFPVEQILLDSWECIEAEIWDQIRQAAAGEKVTQLKPFEPRDYQAAAINAARRHFMKEGNRRGKLIMPCGTGKSLMGYWTSTSGLKAKTVVVAVPSLDLIRQTFAVWAREAEANGKQLDVLIVCSDKSTAEGDSHVDDLAAPATTKPFEIKQWLKNPQRLSDLRVVFVTYQSGKVFADAAGRFQFDVALYDEAHKTAGYEGKRNQYLLHQKNLNVQHRVFMTATERYYEGESDEVVGMNDVRLYGERYHYMPFGAAIDEGILADYSVVLMTIRRSEAEDYRPLIEERMFVHPDLEFEPEDLTAEDLATAVALRKAFRKYKLNHAVSFHSRNQLAAEFVEIQKGLNGAGLSASLKTFRVSSDISTGKRHERLKGFQEAKKALISNARCLTEGVDVPGIDLVLFAQPRQSKVDIVQAVGRALRVPSDQPDKRGYVLVPVLVDDDEGDIEKVVEGTGFENLVSVLKAMATVDEDITDRIDVVVGKPARRGLRAEAEADVTGEALPVRMNVEEFAESLRLRAWDRLEGLKRPRLTIEQILEWADAFHERTGKWPAANSGAIGGTAGETWLAVNCALSAGMRGLPPGSSLTKLLAKNRGIRNQGDLPPLTIEQILEWADEHYNRTGKWPIQTSGEVDRAPEEKWSNINQLLTKGLRGLSGGSSLANLLAKERGVRNRSSLPRLTIEQILEWADAFHERTGKWPSANTGSIVEAPGERWDYVNTALTQGRRGLSGGSSLAKLLAEERGVRNRSGLQPLAIEQILEWADGHYERTGKWPNSKTGEIPESPGDTWAIIDGALQKGRRGISGGSSLAQLLAKERAVLNLRDREKLEVNQILNWADTHHEETGKWPTAKSGIVIGASEEFWSAIDAAFFAGNRGLPGGSSLEAIS
ncbi:MAG: DEAD/DEAH box helicase family protein [Verrucomicrobiales bacterium]|nr:DEAD/DEAH box helicase family protein [Verrucomicrobiales bacterium]